MKSWEEIFTWMLDVEEIKATEVKTRHVDWDDLRDEILSRPGVECMACGGKKNLSVHHIKDFSTHPELEMLESNLVVLCIKSERFKDIPCHRLFGHFLNWQNINPNVLRDASYFRRNVDRMLKSNE